MSRTKIVLLALAALVILVVVALSIPRTSYVPVPQRLSLPNTFSATASYGPNSVVFSNSRTFAAYNFTNGQTKPLGVDLTTPDLSNIDSLSVSTDQQYLLFHDESVAVDSRLYNQLVGSGLNPSLDYWWVYSLVNQTFRPLPAGILLAKFNGGNIDALSSGNGGESINEYAVSSLAKTKTINVSDCNNFFPVDGGYFLQTPSSTVLFTKDGVVSQQLLSGTNLYAETPDNQSVVGVEIKGSKHQLVLLNAKTQQAQVIAGNNVTGQPVQGGGYVLFATSGSNGSKPTNLHTYNLTTHKTINWDPVNTTLNGVGLTPVALSNGTAAIVSDTSNNYYVIGNGLANIQAVDSSYQRTITADGNTLSLQYSPEDGAFVTDLDMGSLTDERAAIYQQLRQDGYNPDFYNVELTIDTAIIGAP